MATNPYVNQVKFGNQTIMDLTPTTATASDVSQGKYFFTASGELTLGTLSGGGGTAVIRDTTDSAGGTIREITTDEELYLTSLSATQNQTYTAPSGTAYDEVVVNVSASPNLQAKTNISPTTSSQTVTADNGYDGLSSVQINAMPTMTLPTSSSSSATTGYTSKATISRSTSDQYINIPTGYNSAGAYYKVNSTANMTLPTSTSASATSGYTSKATVSRSTSDQYINIPTGYNASGAYYKINATPNGTVTAPSTISGSSATVSTGTNTLTLSKTISVTPTVSTAGYVSSGTAGNSNVSLTASVTTQGAKTVTPTTSQQTAVSSGTYVTGNVVVSAMPSGTTGTPTATKGTVSNHAVSVTPSVTNTTGYITGGTKTGTAVTVSASELVSGTKSITENGTGIDVTNYANVNVNVNGIDVPVFSGDDPTAITCNKTFQQCLSLAENDSLSAIAEQGEFSFGLTLQESSPNELVYTYIGLAGESFDYIYDEYENIEFQYPSKYVKNITITENGAYSDPSGAVYDLVTVNVPPSPVIIGTFMFDTAGIKTITIPYTGNGYPVELSISVADGLHNTESDWYSLINRYKVGSYYFIKGLPNTPPNYSSGSGGANDSGRAFVIYKNSASVATDYSANVYSNSFCTLFSSANPSATQPYNCVKMSNATTLKLAVNYTDYSFPLNISYVYCIRYSE